MGETVVQADLLQSSHYNPRVKARPSAQVHIFSSMDDFSAEISTQFSGIPDGVSTRNRPQRTQWKPPTSYWTPICHPHAKEVCQEIDNYFLQNWVFPSPEAEKKFLEAGFSRVTCFYFPLSKDDRIGLACRLLTVLFLVDGELTLIHVLCE
jgi:hypothetical protein